MERRQGRAHAHHGREESGTPLRPLAGAEHLKAGHHGPEHQRRLLGKHLAVEHGHDPIAALEHLAGQVA